MRHTTHRRAFVHNAWLVTGGSLLAMGLLIAALWSLPRFYNLARRSRAAETDDDNPAQVKKDDSTLVVYCAAGLVKPVQEVKRDYEQAYGVRIVIEPGGSGELLQKLHLIKDRADLFIAADSSYMTTARQEGLVAEKIPVAEQHPVIAVKPGNPLHIQSIADLLRPDVRVALAKPKVAAVGSVARRHLSPDTWDKLERHALTQQDTVNLCAQDVKIGAVDAAIVWDATASQYHLDSVEVNEFRAVRDQVQIGVLRRTTRPHRALHFARYLTARNKGAVHFGEHHYEPIADADVWEEEPTVTVMTGAMLEPAIKQTLKEFEEREGARINWVYNGCGILVAQMKSGTIPAAYFSCDVKFMRQVDQWFPDPVNISRNDLVILVQKGNPENIRTLRDLAKPGLRLGLGHPEKAALGELTRHMLQKQGLYQELLDSENIRVESPTGGILVDQLRSGALDAIIVYRSNARSNPENLAKHFDMIDLDLPEAHAVQPFAVARNSQHRYLMERLLETIRSPESRRRFEELGFHWETTPESP